MCTDVYRCVPMCTDVYQRKKFEKNIFCTNLYQLVPTLKKSTKKHQNTKKIFPYQLSQYNFLHQKHAKNQLLLR